MRTLFWIIVLFAMAAGLVVAAHYNTGYVLLVVPPYRVELSLNLLLIVLFAAFVAGYVVVRIVSGTLGLPARVREYRIARRHNKALATLNDALQNYFVGRYARAEKAAASLLKLGEHAGIGAIVAARAAHALRAYERRDAFLAQAPTQTPEEMAIKAVTEAELLLDHRRFHEALNVLRDLPKKHTAVLRLELKAQQMAKNWDEVLKLTAQLEKLKVFDVGQAEQVRRHALSENLRRKAMDSQALETVWQKIPAAERRDSRIAAVAAQSFITLGNCAQARQIIEASLKENWDSELVGLYAECPGDDAVKQIERAEAWLQAHPDDAALLLALGKLCARQELWGKAQSYLEASISIESSCTAHLALAQLQEKLENSAEARKHYRVSLELAVEQLRLMSGGRRRTML
ncbi:MAG: heme biosynthesis HemY N-terminal domain-containing protein [Burkholderiales bacterium]|nr:heme biosynthesis HemY N-terminal domain-containing protein [Burkholderiales bacterium]